MPTPTYWSSEEKLPIGQTKVSIPSDNGLSYQGGQRIIFTIPDNIEYINPINTVLEADFKIDLPAAGQAATDTDAGWTQTRLMLDAELGGSVLIRHIRVYANSAEMPLLDEVQDCNVLASVRYDYHSNDNERKKRALTEGCTMYTPEQRNDRALDQSPYVNTVNNTYFDANIDADNNGPTRFNLTGAGFKTAKLLLPLHESGIFGSSVVFPNKLVGGLRLELELSEASSVVRQLDTVQLNTNLEANPIFHSVDGQDDPAAGEWGAGSASATAEFYVARQNSNDSIAKFPFCIGERMSMKFAEDALNDDFIIWKDGTDAVIYPRINKIELTAATGGQTFALIKITLDKACYPSIAIPAAANNTGGKAINSKNNAHLYSLALTGGNATLDACPSFNVRYTLSNVNLLIERVDMPAGYTGKMMSAMKQGGVLNYDFLTFTNYKYSQQKDDRVANVRIPISNKRCKGVICCPVDSSVYSNMERIGCGNTLEVLAGGGQTFTYEIERVGSLSNSDKTRGDHANHSKRSGLTGCVDGLTRYQFFYNGKLNPSRPVVTSKIADRVSIAQQPLVELEKCLAVCGVPPTSFKQFRSNFIIGRATGLQNGVADLSTTDFNLQVEYQEQGNVPTKPKLWNIYIGHLRRLLIKGDSVQVDV
jgi:hypothetical protein